jgi:zinc finger SWIM domain-containing protein 3
LIFLSGGASHNHHKQTIIFGATLLYNEIVDSFKWLFESFLSAMSGKQPTTILIDQSAVMAKAINEVFPKSNHRLCVWHIYQNAAKHLSHVFHSSKQFADDFGNCVYDTICWEIKVIMEFIPRAH